MELCDEYYGTVARQQSSSARQSLERAFVLQVGIIKHIAIAHSQDAGNTDPDGILGQLMLTVH